MALRGFAKDQFRCWEATGALRVRFASLPVFPSLGGARAWCTRSSRRVGLWVLGLPAEARAWIEAHRFGGEQEQEGDRRDIFFKALRVNI
ncbi:hypothetical protein chiPu_0015293 [Chiloscyllium punctatum]|uniref:Uncharacterized protein n=1 Tax=Chiloscyllium punctatum TaxID=137246 RepID=A0A401T2G3_CHIPU|nr:hypothetical protein [Chiloscyllium punctatum]